MIVRIQVSEEVAMAGVCWWIKYFQPRTKKINSYPVFCKVVQKYVEKFGISLSNVNTFTYGNDQETYLIAKATVKKYYYKTKGGKKMSDTTVQSPEEPKVNGGETVSDEKPAEQPAGESVDPNKVGTDNASDTKPFND